MAAAFQSDTFDGGGFETTTSSSVLVAPDPVRALVVVPGAIVTAYSTARATAVGLEAPITGAGYARATAVGLEAVIKLSAGGTMFMGIVGL